MSNRDNYSNLNRGSKWLGIIDYKLVIMFLIAVFVLWNILGLFGLEDLMRVYIIVIVSIPFLGIIYANKSSENISEVIYIVFKYIVSPKLYVYKIDARKHWLK